MTGGYVEKSFAPAPADLEAIGAFTRRAFAPEELYVFSVVLCNNDVDRDHEKFTRRALEELGALFVGKTGIFDHSMKSGAHLCHGGGAGARTQDCGRRGSGDLTG